MMEPQIVRSRLSATEFHALVQHPGMMIKVVVDVDRHVLALGGDLHADGEQLLLDDGSAQENLWGANVYPDHAPGQRIEFTSLINIRPRQENRSMDIQDPTRREAVRTIIEALLPLS